MIYKSLGCAWFVIEIKLNIFNYEVWSAKVQIPLLISLQNKEENALLFLLRFFAFYQNRFINDAFHREGPTMHVTLFEIS